MPGHFFQTWKFFKDERMNVKDNISSSDIIFKDCANNRILYKVRKLLKGSLMSQTNELATCESLIESKNIVWHQ